MSSMEKLKGNAKQVRALLWKNAVEETRGAGPGYTRVLSTSQIHAHLSIDALQGVAGTLSVCTPKR